MAMGTNSRLDCESRKCQILAAVRKIFSRKGLEGTTTRELAKEAFKEKLAADRAKKVGPDR